MVFTAGAGGLATTRITLDGVASLPELNGGNIDTVDYVDKNYEERTGWKEIVLAPDADIEIKESNAGLTDMSRQLTAYPADATIAPPQQTAAHFVVHCAQRSGAAPDHRPDAEHYARKIQAPTTDNIAPLSRRSSSTPMDGFTQAITRSNLSAGLMLLSLAIAFAFGALHALSPGHGKAMMAAYLVGARGTARHAIALGLVVTVTHTIGVIALGLVMLFAANYVMPERLYPALSAISGLTIAIMGAMLLQRRLRGQSGHLPEDAATPTETSEYDNIPLEHLQLKEPKYTGGLTAVSSRDKGPLSARSLLVLGITGGILPCPSALVVMLSAVALHKVAFGLAMIISFSVGLALVLTTIGICVVHLRAITDRIPFQGKLLARLPVVSAGFVMLIGLFLIVKSMHGGY
jgi:ABC-type nickel/cobalt efflux system permease component RcnA